MGNGFGFWLTGSKKRICWEVNWCHRF